jgi:curved DNA-binding protein CbpA
MQDSDEFDDDHDPAELPEPEEGRSLYQILNLDVDCSTQDVVRAYRSLAVAFHPDKQTEANRVIAEKHFREISRAHDILSNAQKRAIYDVLGEEGLAQKWELGQKLKSPAEMRADFLNQVQQRKVDQLENLVRTKVSASRSDTHQANWRAGRYVHSGRWHGSLRSGRSLQRKPFHFAAALPPSQSPYAWAEERLRGAADRGH